MGDWEWEDHGQCKQKKKKVCETSSQWKKLDMVVVPVISAATGSVK
jgi:hypothetical protein